jgi:hypothetical protein
MKLSRSFVLGAVLVAALACGVGSASQAAPAPAKPADTTSSVPSNYVPITQCREVDTRYASTPGPLAPEATHEIDFAGNPSTLTAQGGQYGCLIPATATAVQVVITATGAAGAGDLAAWPLGSSYPGTRVLSYSPNGDSTTSATIAVSGGDIAVEPEVYATNLIVDVEGYYAVPAAPPAQPEMLTASFGFGGFLGVNTHVVSTIDASGQYQITFDRDITHCVFQATSSTYDVFPRELAPYNPNGGVYNTVLVMWASTANVNNTVDNVPFELTGTCPS